jgi:hypothetical protein
MLQPRSAAATSSAAFATGFTPRTGTLEPGLPTEVAAPVARVATGPPLVIALEVWLELAVSVETPEPALATLGLDVGALEGDWERLGLFPSTWISALQDRHLSVATRPRTRLSQMSSGIANEELHALQRTEYGITSSG